MILSCICIWFVWNCTEFSMDLFLYLSHFCAVSQFVSHHICTASLYFCTGSPRGISGPYPGPVEMILILGICTENLDPRKNLHQNFRPGPKKSAPEFEPPGVWEKICPRGDPAKLVITNRSVWIVSKRPFLTEYFELSDNLIWSWLPGLFLYIYKKFFVVILKKIHFQQIKALRCLYIDNVIKNYFKKSVKSSCNYTLNDVI